MFEYHDTEVPHLLLEVSGLAEAIFSYVQLLDDPLVSRISDVTAFCSNARKDRRILVVHLFEMPPHDSAEFLARIVDHLRARRLLPLDVEVMRYRSSRFRVVASRAVSQALVALDRNDVVVLPSRGDLCMTLLLNRARWSRIAPAPRADAVQQTDAARQATPEAEWLVTSAAAEPAGSPEVVGLQGGFPS